MIFIKGLTKISDTKYSIGYIHYMPFNNKNGLSKTEEQLLQEGKLVDLPVKLVDVTGKDQVLYYNPADNICFWEYIDIATQPTQEQSLQEQISSLGQTVAQEKLKNMQKDSTIEQLGQELAKVKLDLIKLQGGTK